MGYIHFVSHFGQQRFYRPIHRIATDVSVTNHAFAIHHIDGRPPRDIPLRLNGAAGALRTIPKASPSDVLFFYGLANFLAISVTVDTDECERLTCQLFYERPLVRVHSPAGASPIAPEIQHDHFSSVITQFEFFAIEILPGNIGSYFTDGEISHFKNRTLQTILQ